MRSCSPIPRSRRSTIRCPTSCMCPGPSRRSRRASMCCAKSRSRSTPRRRERLIAARDASGKLVAEAFMVRYHPQWRRAREIVRSGGIGDVGAIQTLFAYRLLDPDNIRNKPPGGGGLYDIGCYAILTARYIFGAEPIARRRRARCRSALRHRPAGQRADRISRRPASDLHRRRRRLAGHQRVTIAGTTGRIEVAIPFNAPIDRPTRIVDRHRRRSRRRRRAGRGIRGLRSIYAAGRRVLARRARRGAAGISPRGRDRQHAGDRRLLPLGQERRLGEALSRKTLCVAEVADP